MLLKLFLSNRILRALKSHFWETTWLRNSFFCTRILGSQSASYNKKNPCASQIILKQWAGNNLRTSHKMYFPCCYLSMGSSWESEVRYCSKVVSRYYWISSNYISTSAALSLKPASLVKRKICNWCFQCFWHSLKIWFPYACSQWLSCILLFWAFIEFFLQ